MRTLCHSKASLACTEGRVVVIGGGFAGLAAAKSLQEQSKAKVTLLEASTAVGGRARSVVLQDGQKVELGATWFHGIKGHPIYDLALQYGLMSPHVKSESVDGCETSMDSRTSLGQILRQNLQQLYNESGKEDTSRDLLIDVWAWRELLQRAIDGSDSSDDASAAGLAEYEELPGAWPPVTGGYQAVAKRMASELEDVRLGHVVSKIKYGPDGVEVFCTNGQSFAADAAILTVSLGILKEQHSSLFDPPLDNDKIGAIERLGMGVIDKVFLTFDKLKEDPSSQQQFQLLWRQKASSLLSGPSSASGSSSAIKSCIWSESAEQSAWRRGVYSLRIGGAEFIKDKRVADEVSKINLSGLGSQNQQPSHSDMEQASQPRSAVAWVSGYDAVGMENSSDDEVKEEFKRLFKDFPTLDLSTDFQVTRSNWGMDPFTRGSYSYVTAAASSDDVDILGCPILAGRGKSLKPVICFAGEATSRKYIGTTAGAYFSGLREAKRVIDSLG